MKNTVKGGMQLADPLYKFVNIDPELKEHVFTNPAFSDDIERAREIYNLGLVRHFFESARHSKWEHHLGTNHLISEAKQLSTYLSNEEFRLLKYLNIFSCFGYFPLGYCSSEAVILAALRDDAFKKSLIDSYLQPLFDLANKHASSYGRDQLEVTPDLLIDRYQYKALNAWFGAYKLGKHVDHLPKKLWKNELCYQLLSERSKIKKAYYDLATLEYLQRDLFYTQIVTFNIPIQRAIQDHRKQFINPAYTELISALRATITQEVYTHPGYLTLETLIKNNIANHLVDKSLSIDDLLTKSDSWLEEQLDVREFIKHVRSGSLVLRESILVDSDKISSSDANARTRYDAAKRFRNPENSDNDGYVISPVVEMRSHGATRTKWRSAGYVVYALNKPNLPILIEDIWKLAAIYENTKRSSGDGINSILHRFCREILEYAFRNGVNISYDKLFMTMRDQYKASGIPNNLNVLLRDIKNAHSENHNVISRTRLDPPYIFQGKSFAFLLEYIFFGGVGSDGTNRLLTVLRDEVPKLRGTGQNWNGELLEYKVFLYLYDRFASDDAVVCPSVKLVNMYGDITHEVDFIVICKKANQNIILVECTTSDGDEKNHNDAKKLVELENIIKNRFQSAGVKILIIGPEEKKDNFGDLCNEYILIKDIN